MMPIHPTPQPFSPEETQDILETCREVIGIEIEGLERLRGRIGEDFVRAVGILLKTRGRVVLTGIGKSGLIARKIAATLASTGTPAIFLHPVEAMHGDLGMVTTEDCVVALSNSGETREILALVPAFKRRGVPVISVTGRMDSSLARAGDVVLDAGVEREACALGLAPTASTTTALALGDALAVALLKMRRFSERDFLQNHPAGSLGERLKVRVREVMITGPGVPVVKTGTPLRNAILEMDRKGIGAVLVLDGEESLVGIVTDGDLRRALVKGMGSDTSSVDDVMTANPKTVSPEALAADALALMERHLITVLPVSEGQGRILGVVHLHDLLGKGRFTFEV